METGHEKNVANFEAVIIIVVSLGAIYNPTQALILLPALQAKLAEARAAIQLVDAAEAEKAVAVDEREYEFKGLDKYAVNLKRTAEVEINDAAFTRDLQSIVNKFHAKSKKPALAEAGVGGAAAAGGGANAGENGETGGGRSTSQRSFDNQIAHLAGILALLRTKAAVYKPNDAEYTIAAVEAKIAALETVNTAAKNAAINLGLAQNARDEILYHPDAGVLKRIKLIKLQLARKPGKTSAAYRQVNALEFRKR